MTDLHRRYRARARSILVTALSALVVLAGAYYVAAPTTTNVRLTVEETATVPRVDVDLTPRYLLTAAHPSVATEVIFGKVQAGSIKTTGISLRVAGIKPSTRGQVATIAIPRPDVAFRATVHLAPGLYQFTLTLHTGGRTRTAQIVRTLLDRRNYRTFATVRSGGIVTFVPVTSY